jgi:hypothetical protein
MRVLTFIVIYFIVTYATGMPKLKITLLVFYMCDTQLLFKRYLPYNVPYSDNLVSFNTLRTGDADLRFYITTVQDG